METEAEMPYGADLKTTFVMVEEVGRAIKIQRPELYKHLPSVKNNAGIASSFSSILNLCPNIPSSI